MPLSCRFNLCKPTPRVAPLLISIVLVWIALVGVVLSTAPSVAQVPPLPVQPSQLASTTQSTTPDVEPETFLVVGEQPGPGMWKVSKGDNTLWIIGTQSPMPKNMKWRAKGLRDVVAQSQEILSQASVSVSIGQIGYFRALTMLPSAMEARKNPDNAMLKDLVPADLYARWLPLRDKYVDEFNTDDESKDIERWRPMFAAFELYSKAIKKNGMTTDNAVWPVVRAAAKQHKVPIREIKIEPKIADPRGALKELSRTRLDDLDCFAKTLARIETDLVAMRLRANAWSSGDIEALRKLPFTDQRAACGAAIRNASFVKTLGVQDVGATIQATWLAAAEAALAKNKSTLAVLPIGDMFAENGYLAKLRARGYQVTEPDAQ